MTFTKKFLRFSVSGPEITILCLITMSIEILGLALPIISDRISWGPFSSVFFNSQSLMHSCWGWSPSGLRSQQTDEQIKCTCSDVFYSIQYLPRQLGKKDDILTFNLGTLWCGFSLLMALLCSPGTRLKCWDWTYLELHSLFYHIAPFHSVYFLHCAVLSLFQTKVLILSDARYGEQICLWVQKKINKTLRLT